MDEEGQDVPAWVAKFLKPTKDDFEKNYVPWNVCRSKKHNTTASKQHHGINDHSCPGSASAWDVCNISTVMLFRDRMKLGPIMDAELCLEAEVDLPGRRGFKFMAGLASYHSAHIMHMSQASPMISLQIP